MLRSHTPSPFDAFDREAARRYDDWYATPAGQAMAVAEETLLAQLLSRFPDAASLLEVGSGTGHFARWFAARGLRVTGVDTVPAMLAVAQAAGGGPVYARAAAAQLPFATASHDLAAFVTSLEFVPEPQAALREAARVARRGLLLGVLNLASILGLSRRVQDLWRPSLYRSAHFYTPWELAALVRRALGERVRALVWRTTLWPRWTPGPLRRLPGGAFIAAAVTLGPP